MLTSDNASYGWLLCWIQLKIITFFKKKLLKRLYIINKNKKRKLNAALIDIKVEIHGIAYDLTHLDNLK